MWVRYRCNRLVVKGWVRWFVAFEAPFLRLTLHFFSTPPEFVSDHVFDAGGWFKAFEGTVRDSVFLYSLLDDLFGRLGLWWLLIYYIIIYIWDIHRVVYPFRVDHGSGGWARHDVFAFLFLFVALVAVISSICGLRLAKHLLKVRQSRHLLSGLLSLLLDGIHLRPLFSH